MLFGRHQLIKLSPKKTVEGFVGAFFVTIVFAYFVSSLISSSTSRTDSLDTTVGHSIHAVQLHDLSGTGLGVERILACFVYAESCIRLARVPAADLGVSELAYSRTCIPSLRWATSVKIEIDEIAHRLDKASPQSPGRPSNSTRLSSPYSRPLSHRSEDSSLLDSSERSTSRISERRFRDTAD